MVTLVLLRTCVWSIFFPTTIACVVLRRGEHDFRVFCVDLWQQWLVVVPLFQRHFELIEYGDEEIFSGRKRHSFDGMWFVIMVDRKFKHYNSSLYD